MMASDLGTICDLVMRHEPCSLENENQRNTLAMRLRPTGGKCFHSSAG